ncbi:hypothetical protein T439DRAFT_357326 [Meredithblackwellia eburnea MCA 4105]
MVTLSLIHDHLVSEFAPEAWESRTKAETPLKPGNRKRKAPPPPLEIYESAKISRPNPAWIIEGDVEQQPFPTTTNLILPAFSNASPGKDAKLASSPTTESYWTARLLTPSRAGPGELSFDLGSTSSQSAWSDDFSPQPSPDFQSENEHLPAPTPLTPDFEIEEYSKLQLFCPSPVFSPFSWGHSAENSSRAPTPAEFDWDAVTAQYFSDV